jgi:ATP-dependent protease HslVU (ClpYQ) peptidase subunit
VTCIVAIEHEGKVWMGGDSAACKDDYVSSVKNKKVFIVGDFIIGYSGSFRVGQILEYAFKPPEQDIYSKSDMEYMVIDFVDSLRETLREKGVLLNTEEGESHDSEFLVGYHGQIYSIERDFHVGRSVHRYAACGSGMYYALGALHAMDENIDSPLLGIEKALSACMAFSTNVRTPFTILSL